MESRLWTIAFCSTLMAVLFLSTLPPARGQLMCYNCFLSPSNNACTDASVLVEEHKRYKQHLNSTTNTTRSTAVTFSSELIVVCPGNFSRCVVEYIVDGNQAFKLMYRDCSDGQSFSVDLSGTRLATVGSNPDNITHCAYHSDTKATVCISLCSDHLCNGPQSSAAPARIGPSQSVVVLTTMLSAVFWICVWNKD